jgi:hypothetical protein
MMNEVVIKSNKKRIILILFGMIFLLFVGLFGLIYLVPWLLSNYIGFLPYLAVALVVLVPLVAGIGVIVGTIRLFSSKYVLIINQEGIINKADFSKVGLIPWSNIDRIVLEKGRFNKVLRIFLKDVNGYLDQLSPFSKRGAEMINARYGTPCSIDITALSGTSDEIYAKVQEFLNHFQNQEGV